MRERLPAAVVLGFVLVAAGSAQGLRKPVFAGLFYEADAAKLGPMIDRFLDAAAPAVLPGRVRALIVPHAGYVYSGALAGRAYRQVRNGDFATVVVLGPSHRLGFEGASIWPDGGFETPLGIAAVDVEFARALAKASGFGFVPGAFAEEHSVEVQIPFIQRALPAAKIVPVVCGLPREGTIRALAAGLVKAGRGKKVLVVASTDMSHFLDRAKANAADKATTEIVRGMRTSALLRQVERGENVLCGGGPVLAALLYAQDLGEARVEVLGYADSAAGGAGEDSVVGYLAAAVTAGRGEEEVRLTAEQRKTLLDLARRSVETYVRERTFIEAETKDPALLAPRGAFVTLTKRGSLRGCIGYIEPVLPLAQAVLRCAVYAATEDGRFEPVAPAELGEIAYEISVLTPLRRVADPAFVRVGTHGLVITQGGRRGLLLPQVAVENGWGREEFLAQACVKAGLAPDAWRNGAEISVFEALVFR